MNPNRLYNPFRRYEAVPAIIFFLLMAVSSPLSAQMQEVSDSELSQISAQAGITYNWGNSWVAVSANSYAFSDTDSSPKNWLEFNNISITGPGPDGMGGYFSLDEANEGTPEYPLYWFNTIDIGTLTTIDNKTRTFVSIIDASHTTVRNWSIGQLRFCNQELGSIQFDVRNIDPTVLQLATHGAGMSGIEYEYLSNWKINNFTYNYNTSGGALNIGGIHIAEYASGPADNPADPLTWQFSGKFRIGDIKGGIIDVDDNPSNAAVSNPASFDVGTYNDGTTATTCAFMNLPMKGTIRAESVNFGGNNFGPVAIDGITTHYLLIKLNPGN